MYEEYSIVLFINFWKRSWYNAVKLLVTCLMTSSTPRKIFLKVLCLEADIYKSKFRDYNAHNSKTLEDKLQISTNRKRIHCGMFTKWKQSLNMELNFYVLRYEWILQKTYMDKAPNGRIIYIVYIVFIDLKKTCANFQKALRMHTCDRTNFSTIL